MIKRFTIQIAIRILFILMFCFAFVVLIQQNLIFATIGVGIVILVQVFLMIRYVDNTNYSLSKFLDALKTEDYSVYFSPSKKGDSFQKVFDDFNLIIKIFKRNKIEKEAQYNYFKYILEHVNLGIISIKKDDLFEAHSETEILFLNKAACDILHQPKHKYWHRFASHVPWLVKEIKQMANGGKVLVDFGDETERKQLSLEVIEFQLLNTPYLIITFQDIRSEIEQKEIEAWHNVIRVLAHEMLNSFTPVSSLASTIKDMTDEKNLDTEDIQDIHLAAKTIKKRSDGLLDFVKDYRTISNVPVPVLNKLKIKPFLQEIQLLMQTNADEANVKLEMLPVPGNATVQADRKLIEQVLINLINNSIHALEGVDNATIKLSCSVEVDKTVIMVWDNGKGIDDEILSQIFIPFYTTKKNGSGIGLSLSKNILKKHGGNLLVTSENNKFTNFSLVFRS
ncbi:sensor histidine kinase [Urechidicola vernalis]|uniref:histidine kinase n=1 Tax=Urechidicola vernalis TaxID=3075600 RepID=A0ABU2Y7S9_9FLAO|nr:ATP-binding protein [Urechidicola sp. P050]MDT0554082.1 ATP-binding protein [Urechidicola sp. P050]